MKRIVILFALISGFMFVNDVSAMDETNINDEIFYNIIIDRFNNGDQSLGDHVNIDDPYDYHGGDFIGITQKLDHLESLGFSTIVLSPIVKNTDKGFHGYWVNDFYQVNENYGTLEQFNALVKSAHDRDMKVVVELVTNYISEDHPFVHDEDKQDWIIEPSFTNKSEIESLYWLDNVKQLDHQISDVQEYLIDVAHYWMDETDIDGYKLHAIDQADFDFVQTLTESIKEKRSDFYIIGDVLDQSIDISQLRALDAIDAIENYALFNAAVETFEDVGPPVSHIYDTWEDLGDKKDLLFVETKDTARFANHVALNDLNALTTWKLALTYLYTTPGVPYLYQGSELQMFGLDFADVQQIVRFNSTDPDLEEFHHRISTLRADFPSLVHGDYEKVAQEGALSIFKRSLDDEIMYVALNNDEVMQEVTLSDIPEGKQLRGLLEDSIVRENEANEFLITVPRETAEIFIVEDNVGINWTYIAFVVLVFIVFFTSIIYLSRKQKRREQKE